MNHIEIVRMCVCVHSVCVYVCMACLCVYECENTCVHNKVNVKRSLCVLQNVLLQIHGIESKFMRICTYGFYMFV